MTQYPFGIGGVVSLMCSERTDTFEKPEISVKSNIPLELVIRWDGGEETIDLRP